MPVPLFTQTVIAFLWDFDRTLIPGNQQEALFAEYGVDETTFWKEVEGLVEFHSMNGAVMARDAAYLLHILSYVENGVFPGLTNDKLRELGARLQPSPGMPDFLTASRERVAANPKLAGEGITVEHYVVSTGIRPMIEGSPLADHVDGIWANSFIESRAFSISSILRLTCSEAMSKPPIWREKSATMSQMSSGLPIRAADFSRWEWTSSLDRMSMSFS